MNKIERVLKGSEEPMQTTETTKYVSAIFLLSTASELITPNFGS